MAMSRLAVMILALLFVQNVAAASSVELQALLGDTAVLLIDGERKTLRKGQSQNDPNKTLNTRT